jgi:hypothetical protein
MKKKFSQLLLFYILLPLAVFSQENITLEVSKQRIIRDVYTLASDSLEGRKFNQIGHSKAVNYIVSEFQKAGLKGANGYIQEIPVSKTLTGATVIEVNSRKLYNKVNFSFASSVPVQAQVNFPLKFMGWEKQIPRTPQGDTALHIFSSSVKDGMKRVAEVASATGSTYFFLTLGKNEAKNTRLISAEANAENMYYPQGVFSMGSKKHKWLKDFIPEENSSVKVFLTKQQELKSIYGAELGGVLKEIAENGENNVIFTKTPMVNLSANISFPNRDSVLFDRNILGYIEGTDLKDEYIILCAHYDHLGSKGSKIYYGADDNASGTAAIMELARVLSEARDNGAEFRRSIVFIAFGAEETGLNGSHYYVSNPTFPIEKTVMVMNFDMVGRPEKVAGNSNHIFSITYNMGSLNALRTLREVSSQLNGFKVLTSMTLKDKILYKMGSDHYPFTKKGVPALVFTTSTHNDYHKVTDTPDKINFNNMLSVVKTAAVFVVEVANNPKDFPNKRKRK